MRIGFSGKVGICLILIALACEAALQLLWEPAFPQYIEWEPFSPFLLFLLLVGLLLLLRSILLAIQEGRIRKCYPNSLTAVGPLGPEWRTGAIEGAHSGVPPESADLPPPRLIFQSSAASRKVLRLIGDALILLGIVAWAAIRNGSLIWLILIVVGVVLMAWPAHDEVDELRFQAETRATFKLFGRFRKPFRRPMRHVDPLSSLRMWSYYMAMILWMTLFPLMVLEHLTTWGLDCYIPRLSTLSAWNDPWNEPVVARVSIFKQWYLNQKPVSHADLKKRLQLLLSTRGDRTVFVDGDESNQYGYTADAVSEILKVPGTRVVLVTPSMKAEAPKLDGRSPCEVTLPNMQKLEGRPKMYAFPFLSFRIDERGIVSSLVILQNSGDPDRDARVVRRLQQWKFTPMPGCGTQEIKARM